MCFNLQHHTVCCHNIIWQKVTGLLSINYLENSHTTACYCRLVHISFSLIFTPSTGSRFIPVHWGLWIQWKDSQDSALGSPSLQSRQSLHYLPRDPEANTDCDAKQQPAKIWYSYRVLRHTYSLSWELRFADFKQWRQVEGEIKPANIIERLRTDWPIKWSGDSLVFCAELYFDRIIWSPFILAEKVTLHKIVS
jgi:hypothetical protein